MDKEPCFACAYCDFTTEYKEYLKKHNRAKHYQMIDKYCTNPPHNSYIAKNVKQPDGLIKAAHEADTAVNSSTTVEPDLFDRHLPSVSIKIDSRTDGVLNDIKPRVKSLCNSILSNSDAFNPNGSPGNKPHITGMECSENVSQSNKGHGSSTSEQEMPSHFASLCEVKEEIRYCQSCSYCDADFVRLRSHVFQHHPAAAAVVANSSEEANCSLHDIKFFCVKEACTFSTSVCDIYEEHLMSCCILRQNLSNDTKGRLKSTLEFILDFHNKHSIRTAYGFLDYVFSFNTLFTSTGDKVKSSKDLGCNKSSLSSDSVSTDSANCSDIRANLGDSVSSVPTPVLLLTTQNEGLNRKGSMTGISESMNLSIEEREGNTKLIKADPGEASMAQSGGDDSILENNDLKSNVEGKSRGEMSQDELEMYYGTFYTKNVEASTQQCGKIKMTTQMQPDVDRADSLYNDVMRMNAGDFPTNTEQDSDNLHGKMKTDSSQSLFEMSENFARFGQESNFTEDMRLQLSSYEMALQSTGGAECSENDYEHDNFILGKEMDQSFKCVDCGKSFGKKGNLSKHMKTHSGVKSFICNECGKSFTDKSNLIRHVRTHTGERPFQCKDCDKNFVQNCSLIKHMKTHTIKKQVKSVKVQREEKPFKCEECGHAFGQKNNLINHMRIHTGEKPYKCSACDKSFSEKSNLLRHIRTHTGEKPFTCPECGKTFGQSSNLHKHIRIHTGEKPFVCNACGKCFGRNTNLLKHIRTHTGEKPYKCEECGKSYGQNSNLLKHLRTHTGEKPFKCNECGKKFTQNSYLINHMRTHTGDKPFQCKECGKHFSQTGNLIQHMKTHTGERPFQCNECNSSFCFKINLIKHMRKHTGERPFSCEICGRTFQRHTSYTEHKRTHTGEKPFKCNVCGKRFGQNGNLTQHMRGHTGDKPFVCSECGMGFHLNSRLIRHKRSHTGEKPYKCNECGKSFGLFGNLNKHKRIHTGERPFKCNECGKTFGHSSTLITHMNTHSEERPYRCTVSECGKSFAQNRNLITHMKSHTREKRFTCKECGKSFHKNSVLIRHMASHMGEKPFKCDECGKTFSQNCNLNRHVKTHTAEKDVQM